jgi:hypothetical protein
LTRREAIRKGAVVGGHLLWIAPVIQTLTPKAYAQVSPEVRTCCACHKTGGPGSPDICKQCSVDTFSSEADCKNACAARGEGGTTCGGQFRTNSTGFTCNPAGSCAAA